MCICVCGGGGVGGWEVGDEAGASITSIKTHGHVVAQHNTAGWEGGWCSEQQQAAVPAAVFTFAACRWSVAAAWLLLLLLLPCALRLAVAASASAHTTLR